MQRCVCARVYVCLFVDFPCGFKFIYIRVERTGVRTIAHARTYYIIHEHVSYIIQYWYIVGALSSGVCVSHPRGSTIIYVGHSSNNNSVVCRLHTADILSPAKGEETIFLSWWCLRTW